MKLLMLLILFYILPLNYKENNHNRFHMQFISLLIVACRVATLPRLSILRLEALPPFSCKP